MLDAIMRGIVPLGFEYRVIVPCGFIMWVPVWRLWLVKRPLVRVWLDGEVLVVSDMCGLGGEYKFELANPGCISKVRWLCWRLCVSGLFRCECLSDVIDMCIVLIGLVSGSCLVIFSVWGHLGWGVDYIVVMGLCLWWLWFSVIVKLPDGP